MNAKIRLSIVMLFALWLGVSLSCQSSSGPSPDLQGPQSLLLELSFDNDLKRPDSGSWAIRQDSGGALVESIGERAYSAKFGIPSPVGSDELWLTLWTSGLRLVRVQYVWRDGEVVRGDRKVVYDSATLAVVAAIRNLAGTDSQVALDKGGAAFMFARAILANDSLARFVPHRLPGGLDSQRVFDSLVTLAARSGRPYKQILTNWSLGKDSSWLQARVAKLVASGLLLSADSAKIFPPPPVRLKTPLSVVSDLVAGGAEQSVSGEFAWDSGAVTVEASIWCGSDSVTERFQVFLVAAPGAKDTTWNLSKLVLKAREGIDTGNYELQVLVSDTKGNSAKGLARLRVVAAPPGTPCLVRQLPQRQEGTVLPFDSAELRMEWVVRNPTNFDDTTFRVDGTVPFKRNDSVWTASVAIAPDGREKTIAIRARSKSGEAISDYVKVMRLRDSAGPTIVWVSPASEVVVDFAVESFQVKLRAIDPSGIDSVWIDGTPASLLDGSWQVAVRLDPTGVVRDVHAIALDKAGNRSDSVVRIGRGKDNIRPIVVPRIASGVWPHDSVSATLSWAVTDNHQVGVVKIGDSLAHRSGDAYALRVPLKMGANRFVLVASDTSGNVRSDTVVLVRAAGVPVHTLPERRYIGRVWDTVSSVDADSLEWSVDGKSWRKVDGPIPVDQSGTYQVRAWPGPSESKKVFVVSYPVPFFGKSSNAAFFKIGDSLFATGWNYYGQIPGQSEAKLSRFTYVGIGYAKVFPAWNYTLLSDKSGAMSVVGMMRTMDANFSDVELLPAGGSADLGIRSSHFIGWKTGGVVYLDDRGIVYLRERAILPQGEPIGDRIVFRGAVDVQAGDEFLLVRDSSNNVWVVGTAWGRQYSVPSKLFSNVEQVAVGDNHAIMLSNSGQVYGIGTNRCGCLGLGDYESRDTVVPLGVRAVAIAADNHFSAFIGFDGGLWAVGSNQSNAISSNAERCIPSFLRVADSVNWVALGGAFEGAEIGEQPPLPFLFYSKYDGSLYGRGFDAYGALGTGLDGAAVEPVRIHF